LKIARRYKRKGKLSKKKKAVLPSVSNSPLLTKNKGHLHRRKFQFFDVVRGFLPNREKGFYDLRGDGINVPRMYQRLSRIKSFFFQFAGKGPSSPGECSSLIST